MKTIVYNSITSKSSKNFENKVAKLLHAGISEIYISSCGMQRSSGYTSYYSFLDIEINNNGDKITLKFNTNSAPAWDEWKSIESGSRSHDNWNKNTALMIFEDQKKWLCELLNLEDEN